MKFYLIALAGVALICLGCSDDNPSTSSGPEEAPFAGLAVCAPEELVPDTRTCMPDDKPVYYAGVWKAKFMARNGISEEYFENHISSVSTWSNCSASGIIFRVEYRLTIDWAKIDRQDQFIVMLYSSYKGYQHLDIPRDVFLDDDQIDYILDNRVASSSVGPIVPLESLPYSSCSEAILAFQDSTESQDILPTRIAYYVPGKIPREDGYPYFIGRGDVDLDQNVCIKGHFNLFTGESEAWLDACVVE